MRIAYFSEAGTDKDSPIICIGGFIFDESDKVLFEKKYNDILIEYLEKNVKKSEIVHLIPLIHKAKITDVISGDEFFMEMGKLLNNVKAKAIYSVVVRKDWDNLIKSEKFLEQFPNPYFLCLEDVLRQLWEWTARYAPSEKSQPIFTCQPEYKEQIFNQSQRLLQTGWYNKHLLPVNFNAQESYAFLHAADFCARSEVEAIQNRINDDFGLKSKAFDCATNGHASLGHWFNERGLRLTIKRFNETGEIYTL